MSLTGVIIGTILMILLAGILGGGINCLQARKADEPAPRSRLYYFLLSIAAAFSVPLFLSLTKSELLQSVLSTSSSPKAEDWFILFAICLVAAIYAQSFLESVSKNLLQRVESAETKSQQAVKIAVAADERSLNVPIDAAAKTHIAAARAALVQIGTAPDPETQKVLDALKNPKYPLGRRTLLGMASETRLNTKSVGAILDNLIKEDRVHKEAGEISETDYYVLRAPSGQRPE